MRLQVGSFASEWSNVWPDLRYHYILLFLMNCYMRNANRRHKKLKQTLEKELISGGVMSQYTQFRIYLCMLFFRDEIHSSNTLNS